MNTSFHHHRHLLLGLAALALASGCATTQVTSQPYTAGRLAKPDRILVYNFAASKADFGSSSEDDFADSPARPTQEQLQAGRQLGADIASRLVSEIRDMGLEAAIGNQVSPPREGEIVIRGYFTAIDEGSAAKRVVIGFGSGKAEVKLVVEGYVMTAHGLRKVGGGTVDSAGGKGPGTAVPLIVTIATANPIGLVVSGAVKAEGEISGRSTTEGAAKRAADQIAERLKARFEKEGWI